MLDSIISTATPARRPTEIVDVSPLDLLEMRYDEDCGVMWAFLSAQAPVCFTARLLRALENGQRRVVAQLRNEIDAGNGSRLRYQVFGSRIPGVFSLGGDLAFFKRCVEREDRDRLSIYARDCLNLVFNNANDQGLPLTSISLVQGDALGGGFEAALAADVLIAETQAKLGFPEILFNMFPGMGAYSLLKRRVSPRMAEEIILSGRNYTAVELFELGVVDVLADPGEGSEAVMRYVRQNESRHAGITAFRRATRRTAPINHQELSDMLAQWVERAMELTPRDLRMMDHLCRRQQQSSAANQALVSVQG